MLHLQLNANVWMAKESPKVIGQHGQQTAITDAQADTVRLQHLQEKSNLSTDFLTTLRKFLLTN